MNRRRFFGLIAAIVAAPFVGFKALADAVEPGTQHLPGPNDVIRMGSRCWEYVDESKKPRMGKHICEDCKTEQYCVGWFPDGKIDGLRWRMICGPCSTDRGLSGFEDSLARKKDWYDSHEFDEKGFLIQGT